MYIEEEALDQALDGVLEANALEQASHHLDRVWNNCISDEMQDKHLVMAYLSLIVAGKEYEAKLVQKMAKLDDELERSVMALWVLGARLESPGFKEEWHEQARDTWYMMILGSALQGIEGQEWG